MKLEQTQRGFPLIKFNDHYDSPCTIQVSSAAEYEAIWIGLDDANPQVLASRAEHLGMKVDETTGWVPYPVPEDVLLSTRMHLTRDEVAELLPILQRFVETGELDV
jgi:hypothetical protein